ncbi:hypothetical protein J2128_000320 [Methanomicrobium sp. W14]|uniref:hypothetical protein n=1 Tax=Methanomicrobium sp. W14 TaxID=2817839 RepID=UPI001AE3279D|nr:hypothetical protein [Methanomicrobium sp. W14]MBP2132399.1 hypothetical protein [Methanomicrobium sp. W14]
MPERKRIFLKIPNPFFLKSEKNKLSSTKIFFSASLLLFCSVAILSGQVCASALSLPGENTSGSNGSISSAGADYFLSYTNFTSDEILGWRNTKPNVSYEFEYPGTRCNYRAVFFPDISGDEKLAGYYMKVLSNGVSTSYTEIVDADATPPSPEDFLSRAEDWGKFRTDSVIVSGDNPPQCRPLLYDDYYQIARHTTVREYQGKGKVTATTVFSQSPGDLDPERDYFCIGSHVEMKAENESGNPTGWKNSEFYVNYNFAAGYDSMKSWDAPAMRSHPQTSSKYMQSCEDTSGGFLNTFDKLGLFSGLFGHSVRLHSDNFSNLTWTARCGYFTESASVSLSLNPVSETAPKQYYLDDYDWHVLAGVGTNANSGWSRLGGLIREPSDSPECTGYILVQKVPDGNYSGDGSVGRYIFVP